MAVNKRRDFQGQMTISENSKNNNKNCVCIDITKKGGSCFCPDQSAPHLNSENKRKAFNKINFNKLFKR